MPGLCECLFPCSSCCADKSKFIDYNALGVNRLYDVWIFTEPSTNATARAFDVNERHLAVKQWMEWIHAEEATNKEMAKHLERTTVKREYGREIPTECKLIFDAVPYGRGALQIREIGPIDGFVETRTKDLCRPDFVLIALDAKKHRQEHELIASFNLLSDKLKWIFTSWKIQIGVIIMNYNVYQEPFWTGRSNAHDLQIDQIIQRGAAGRRPKGKLWNVIKANQWRIEKLKSQANQNLVLSQFWRTIIQDLDKAHASWPKADGGGMDTDLKNIKYKQKYKEHAAANMPNEE